MANPNDLERALAGDKNLRGADLRGADLREAKLLGADLSDADLKDANLTEANLTEADLRGADLRNADLSDANLSGAKLSRFEILNIRGALTLGQKMSLYGSTSLKKGDILSSKTNPEEYRVVSVRFKGGWLTANIVNTKNKKRYTKRVYQGGTVVGSGFLFYVKNRRGHLFASQLRDI